MPRSTSPSPDKAMDIEDDTSLAPSVPGSSKPEHGKLWRDTSRWTRWLHVYVSMIALLLVLFFGLTGVTLNHPEWTFGMDPAVLTSTGILPSDWSTDVETLDYLSASEFFRDEFNIRGEVSDFGSDATDAFISYRGPGYAADALFVPTTGEYTVTIEQQGWVGVLNDLHKGRDTNSPWKWFIDVSGILLVVIAVTGLGMQLLMKKRRRSALVWMSIGFIGTVALTVFAIN